MKRCHAHSFAGLRALTPVFKVICFYFLLLPAIVHVVESSYSALLEPGQRECLLLRAPNQPSSVRGNYDLMDDEIEGSLVTVWFEDIATGKSLWDSSAGMTEDTFMVELEAGKRYSFCMESRVDGSEDGGDITIPVGFNIRLKMQGRTLRKDEDGPDARRALALLDTASMVETDWADFMDHFDFLRNREAIHASLTNQILERVMLWTIIEAGLVITMAIGQVLYWRKFFEQRRFL